MDKNKKWFNEEEIGDHISYLQNTLIPDLMDSGSDATADDFTTCVNMIEFLLDQCEILQTK